jgi:hypothetical protein
MVKGSEPFQIKIEAKKSDPIEVKVVVLARNVQTENSNHHKPADHKEHLMKLPTGPFVPIKNKDPPTIVEEYKDDSNS